MTVAAREGLGAEGARSPAPRPQPQSAYTKKWGTLETWNPHSAVI